MVEVTEGRAFWRKALYLTILAGRESVWAAIGTNGIPWLTNLGFSESRAASFTFISGFSAIILVKKTSKFENLTRARKVNTNLSSRI